MKHIRRNDTVSVIAGKDKGKTGKVIRIFTEEDHALVQGINFVKKHQRKSQVASSKYSYFSFCFNKLFFFFYLPSPLVRDKQPGK